MLSIIWSIPIQSIPTWSIPTLRPKREGGHGMPLMGHSIFPRTPLPSPWPSTNL